MKITKTQLKQIIKEELGRVLNEAELSQGPIGDRFRGDDKAYWKSKEAATRTPIDDTQSALVQVMVEMGATSEDQSNPVAVIFKQMVRDKGVPADAAENLLRDIISQPSARVDVGEKTYTIVDAGRSMRPGSISSRAGESGRGMTSNIDDIGAHELYIRR